MVNNSQNSKFLGLPILRLVKYFVLSFIFPVILISLLATLLPKRHAAFNVEEIKFRNSPLENTSENIALKSESYATKKINNLDQIKNALSSGKYSELIILRPEYLGSETLKEATILPSVKDLLLKHLKSVMVYDDWAFWKEKIRHNDRNKSDARNLVDKILVINFELGRYLETAGLLYSSLYISTSNGRLFSSEDSLYSLLLQSNEIFSQRTPTAISSRIFLDTLITEDLVFANSLENLRSELIVRFCKKLNQELDFQFLLLSSIKSEYLSQEVIEIYSSVLNTVSQKVPPRFREELRQHYFLPDRARVLSQVSPVLESAIFDLYKSSILSFLDLGDLNRAKSNFLQLTSIVSNNEKLKDLQASIDREINTEDNITVSDKDKEEFKIADKTGRELEQRAVKLFPTNSKPSEGVNMTFQGISLVAAILILVIILVKRLRNMASVVLMWIISKLLKIGKKIFYRKSSVEDNLIDELDASIKSGKTVPMTNIPRSRQNASTKKAVNN